MKGALLLLRWSIVAVTVGPLCGYIVVVFKRLATISGKILYTQPDTLYYAMPFGGALVVAALYLFVPGASGEGMPSYVEGILGGEKKLPLKVTIAKFFSAAIVLASGCSGGMVGPVARVTGGMGQQMGAALGKLGFEAAVMRRAAICGAAAGISAVLGAPVAGGIFAVEILYADGISYEDIFPALLSAATSFLVVCTRYDYEPFLGTLEHSGSLDLTYLPALVVVALAATGVGVVFAKVFALVRDFFAGHVSKLGLRCLFGAAIVVLAANVFGRAVMGPGTEFIKDIVAGQLPSVRGISANGLADFPGIAVSVKVAVILLILTAGKMITTSFTIGSGLSAGLTYPSILIGAAVGSAGARLAGLEVSANLETHYAFVACGVAAVLSSVMNIPLTAVILVAEIFGLNQSMPGIIGSVAAYSLARHIVIYRYK